MSVTSVFRSPPLAIVPADRKPTTTPQPPSARPLVTNQFPTMNTFQCTCGNRLFFNNTVCINCGSEVGWCEVCHTVSALEPRGDAYRCLNSKCGATVVKCRNYSDEHVCNRVLVESNSPPVQGGAGEVADSKGLCKACRLNDVIPDLAIEGNRERWAKLELAKRRLLTQLDELNLKYAPEDIAADAVPHVKPLVFDFKANTPEIKILTGHADGRITINIAEADTVVRERLRKQMHEPHRTLIGHLRHEIGHYYWMTHVQDKCEDECITVFGDHRNPPYADALKKYYETGPAADWQGNFVSAYATAHPWEDFAETWGFYLDMWAVLTTMHHHLPALAADPYSLTIGGVVRAYQQLGIFFNEVNRTMGLKDLVPEVISPAMTAKLAFIDQLIGRVQTADTFPIAAAS
jgi:hypothetical protein